MADYVDKRLRKFGLTVEFTLAILCLTAALVAVMVPGSAWLVGLFLALEGAFLLADHFQHERSIPQTASSQDACCVNCGAENSAESVYCKNCGKQLAPQATQVAVIQPQEVVQHL